MKEVIVRSALLVLSFVAFAQGTPASARTREADGGTVACKTTVCDQGIISIYSDGSIDLRPWTGPQRKWQTGLTIVDYLAAERGVLYLLTDKGLLEFSLDEGPQSAGWVIQFHGNQRYLEIIGEAKNGVWLLRPAVAIDLVESGHVLEHFQYDQLPVPPTRREKFHFPVPMPFYTGMVGGVPYLVMMYAPGSYGYLVYNAESKDWDGHFMSGKAALMPLVLEGKRLKELAVGKNARSFPAPPGLASTVAANHEGLYERIGLQRFLTAMVGSPLRRQGVVIIDTAHGNEVVFHRDPPDLSRQGVYVRSGKVWLWDLGWIDQPHVTSFSLPLQFVNAESPTK